MATIIGVGMQMTASAAGMTKGLSEADRALQLLQKIVEQNQTSLQKFGTEATKTSTSLDKLTRGVGVLSTIEIGRAIVDGFQAISSVFTSAAQNVLSLASNVSQSLDSLNDLSARTGIGVEALQGYSLAAKMAGVDVTQFGTAIQKLSVNIGKADPGGAFEKSLQGIGLTLQQLRGLNPEQQFAAIGDAISQLPTAADRAAAAVEIFGEQGAALAPLFREGAASIDELRERAERLGIIVSETQVNNVAAMNDAFDLVRATVEGIIGQVVGNLAPAVTEVANQFLEFVETFQGVDGTGGTGIANAITDVLLQGAKVLAGVFDYAVAQFDAFAESFGGFASQLSGFGDFFSRQTTALLGLAETFRFVFNLFELAGNGIAKALGSVLEGIGSYVSSDLEAIGQELQRSADAAIEANANQATNAINNATAAIEQAWSDAPEQAAEAGSQSATAFVESLEADIQQSRKPEFQIQTNIEQTRERFQAFFKDVGDEQGIITAAMQEYEAAVAEATADGVLLADEIERIEAAQANVNSLLDQERANRQAAADAAKKQADEDERRVAGLLKTSDAAAKIEEDLAAVYREQARVQEDLASARSANLKSEATTASARLAQLDQLQAKLEQNLAAAEQGFADGFDKAFRETGSQINELVQQAGRLAGKTGLPQQFARDFAAVQEEIARIQKQARNGLLNKDQYSAAIATQKELLNEFLKGLEQTKAREQELDKARFQQQVDANNRINAFLEQQLFGRTEAEKKADEEKFARQAEAVRNIEEIEKQIAFRKTQLEQAREDNDFRAARARQSEIKALETLQKTEEQIASGKLNAAQQGGVFAAENAAAQEAFAKEQERQQQEIFRQQQQFLQEQARAQQAEYERQVARITELNTLGQRQVNTADIRTQEGAALVLNLAANAQDPALIEARLQSKYLRQINENIQAEARQRSDRIVAIVGANFANTFN